MPSLFSFVLLVSLSFLLVESSFNPEGLPLSVLQNERLLRVTRAQCARVCGVKMTLECCECIGCHQGMRFGKRSGAMPVMGEMEEY